MTTQSFASIWDAIEDTPEEAEKMKRLSNLMMQLHDHITNTGISQAEAAKLFGVSQQRVSDLVQGKVNLFTIDALVAMATAAGLPVEMQKTA